MASLQDFLRKKSDKGVVGCGVEREAAMSFGITVPQVEREIMALGMMPSRYKRNAGSISAREQQTLLGGRVAVVGCGGLGGYVIEALARLGVGTLVVVDPEVFEDHNMNRQILATTQTLGASKAASAKERVGLINSAVSVESHAIPFDAERSSDILAGVAVAIDALDSIPVRLDLEDACERLAIPLVHAAIAGWYLQITTVMPGDRTLRALYRSVTGQRGRESAAGIPSFTPLVAAGIQTAEASRILIGREPALRHKILHLDLERMIMDVVSLERGIP